MAAQEPEGRPWLIAAWPGMGNVAVIAAGYLIRTMGMREIGELSSRDHFDISEVWVKRGRIVPPRLPRGVFFEGPVVPGQRRIIVFLAEAQPSTGVYAYAHELMREAQRMGVERVITFASMASALHPGTDPKVVGAATDERTLGELRRAEVSLLADGQIGGLNGVLLAAARERGVVGACLLAEIPFFAAAVPNPKAARVALSVFGVLTGLDFTLKELSEHAEAVDQVLIEAYEKLKAQGAIEGNEEPEGEEQDTPEGTEAAPPPAPVSPEPSLDYSTRRRIEQLFDEARRDASKAMALKQELDRLGVFRQYEDRFLDLFRSAG